MGGSALKRHRQTEACGRCHSRRTAQTDDYAFGRDLLDTHRLSMPQSPLYYHDGQILDEVYVYGSFLQSRMHLKGVTCSNCHDPHGTKLKFEGNAVCTQCHNPGGRPEFPTLKAA